MTHIRWRFGWSPIGQSKKKRRGITSRAHYRLSSHNCRSQPCFIARARIGLSTNSAKATTAKFISAVTTNTMCQLPVADLIKLATGTRKAEVPLAVYSRLKFTVANFGPNVSVQVDGNRLKISPQVRKIRAANSTKAQGAVPSVPNSQ